MTEKIEDKLGKIKYKSDIETHLKVCQKDCQNCKKRSCEIVCPAKVYESVYAQSHDADHQHISKSLFGAWNF